jgi:hypothetical protein
VPSPGRPAKRRALSERPVAHLACEGGTALAVLDKQALAAADLLLQSAGAYISTSIWHSARCTRSCSTPAGLQGGAFGYRNRKFDYNACSPLYMYSWFV